MNWKIPLEIAEKIKQVHAALEPERKAKLKKILAEGRNELLRAHGKDAPPPAGGPAPTEFSLAYDMLFEPERLLEDVLKEAEPRVKPDGTIIGTGKYETLDVRWSLALIEWIELMTGIRKHAPFRVQPEPYKTIPIKDACTVAVLGDWGTGKYGDEPSPPVQMADYIKKNPCDYYIHLGDVYYGGTSEQEKENFLDLWPGDFDASWSLNSNHEMYDGAKGYFEMIAKFKQEYSYFALENSHWILVGLDTAYYSDPDKLFLEGGLGGDEHPEQAQYLAAMAERARKGDKSLILFSHHNAISFKGDATIPLWQEITKALGPNPPRTIWYFGHVHAAAVYKPRDGIDLRLVGHGAVPWGLTSELEGADQVVWFEKKPNNVKPDFMIMNGYAVLTLNGASIKEEILDQTGAQSWSA